MENKPHEFMKQLGEQDKIMEEALAQEEQAPYTGIDQLGNALAAAQANFPPVPKNKTGKVKGTSQKGVPYEYEYKYADLADVLRVILPKLSEQGIAVFQPLVRVAGTGLLLTTLLVHKSGQSLQSGGIKITEGDMQNFGSQLSYARRYDFCALVGVSPDEDTDAAGPTEVQHTAETKTPPKKPTTPKVDHQPAKGTNAPRPGEADRPAPQAREAATPAPKVDNPAPKVDNVHGLNVTDEDLPIFEKPAAPTKVEDREPNAEEKKAYGAKLRGYKLDPAKLHDIVLRLACVDATAKINKAGWEHVLALLDDAATKKGGILEVYKID